MPLLARMLATPIHIDIRPGAVGGLAGLLEERRISTNGRVAVAVGPGLGQRVLERLGGSFPSDMLLTVSGGSVDDALALADQVGRASVDAIVAIGGGRTLDVAKFAATRLGAPMVSVATNLAHDGLASPVAVLEVDGRRHSFGVAMPIAVVVDLDFVRNGPVRQVRSGIGDVLSNLSALADWRLAADLHDEPFDGLAAAFARSGSESILRSRDDLRCDRFLTRLSEALVLSGMAMSVAGTSRPCSGACHEISHALDLLVPGRATHGEQVGVGALFASHLRRDDRLFAELLACLRHFGCPTSPADLGIDIADFVEAVMMAPSTRPDRYTILEHCRPTREDVFAAVAELTARVEEADAADHSVAASEPAALAAR